MPCSPDRVPLQLPGQGKDLHHGGAHRLPFRVDLAVVKDVDVDVAVPGVAVTGDEQAPAPGDILQAVDQRQG